MAGTYSEQTRMERKVMRRVYVFSIPLRIFHWLNAVCIVVLIGTGLIIANPPAIMASHEAYASYWFGTTRFIHFIAAYIFTAMFAYRIYLLFNGNQFERWFNFVPNDRKFLKEIWEVVKLDVLLKRNRIHLSVGHNALAGFSYFVLFLCMLIMVFTGFALYENMSTAWFPSLFGWVTALFGGDIMTRIVHHTFMWVFVLFTLVHVYLVFYHDYVEGRGETSSMIGGWKFIEDECLEKKERGEV